MEALVVGGALVLGGAALLWGAWAGSQGQLAPNGVIGIRTPATRRSEAAWYAAHRAAAAPLGLGGAVAVTGGLGILFTGLDLIGQILMWVALAGMLTGAGLATFAALRAARAA